MDTASNLLTRDFNSCLDSFGLQQYVNFPTHSKGHTLDLICCSGVTPRYCTADVIPISDHKLLSFNVDVTLSKSKQQRLMSFRNIKKIDPSVQLLIFHPVTSSLLLTIWSPFTTLNYSSSLILLHLLKLGLYHSPILRPGSLLNFASSKPEGGVWNVFTNELVL